VRSTLRIVGSAVLKLFVAVSVAKAGQEDQRLLQLGASWRQRRRGHERNGTRRPAGRLPPGHP
jgi:hypothetical protein